MSAKSPASKLATDSRSPKKGALVSKATGKRSPLQKRSLLQKGGAIQKASSLQTKNKVAVVPTAEVKLNAELNHGLDEALRRALRDREALEGDVDRMRRQINDLHARLETTKREVEWMAGTRSWALTSPLRSSTVFGRKAGALAKALPSGLVQLAERVRAEGVRSASSWLTDVVRATTQGSFGDEKDFFQRQLKTILARYPKRPIIVAPPLVDWNVPLFQRPQHLAVNLAKEGFLYFYCTANAVYDRYDGFVQVAPGCFITNQIDLMLELNRSKIVHLCSTAMRVDLNFVKKLRRRGDRIVYEYIDELHPDISGAEIPRAVMQRHYSLLADDSVACVATADKLLRDAESVRSSNYALVTNGVEYEHFASARKNLPVPRELAPFGTGKRPVIGYFGALAKWFDYEMVRNLAKKRPNYDILLIGVDYDGSVREARLNQFKNIKIVGPINYRQLPRYAQIFDVSTIPFVINEVTESTSPIKLFEYMAMGRPIVTSAMPECRKYASCLIANDADDFVAQVDKALGFKNDDSYLRTLKQEALQNTWQSKANQMGKLLTSAFGVQPNRED